ncbi:hypothetical protein RRG08_039584 [Elysia crispata]|uniref:Uncharacterized protein n=1 Tax=Elysia crispata TaxID=231223 RepID=A0AAE1E6Y5_9GAST|nr:hypothetical protein RRG08_039584 [Elysia crispata]
MDQIKISFIGTALLSDDQAPRSSFGESDGMNLKRYEFGTWLGCIVLRTAVLKTHMLTLNLSVETGLFKLDATYLTPDL